MSDDVMTKTDMVVASYDSSYFTYASVDEALKKQTKANTSAYLRVLNPAMLLFITVKFQVKQ